MSDIDHLSFIIYSHILFQRCQHCVVVLFLQVHRLHGLFLHGFEKEEQPADVSARDPPHDHARVQLGVPQVGGGRPLHLLHVPQHGSPRGDVLLLPHVRPRPSGPEVSLVEKIHNW